MSPSNWNQIGGFFLALALFAGACLAPSQAIASVVLDDMSSLAADESAPADEPIHYGGEKRLPDRKKILTRAIVPGQMTESMPRGPTDGVGNCLPPIHTAPLSPLVTVLPSESSIRLPPALESGLFRPPRTPQPTA
jgi:hypothetical protein